MKKIFLFTLLALSASANAQTTYPTGATGCVARWNFTSGSTITTVPDVSGNGNNGTAFNLTTASGFRNIPNNAVRFNGTNSYALVPNSPKLTATQMTTVALVYLDTFNYSGLCQGMNILSKGAPDRCVGYYSLVFSDNIYDGSCYTYTPSKNQIGSDWGTTTFPRTPGNYVSTRKWYFIASTFDGSKARDYQVEMDPLVHATGMAPMYTSPVTNTGIGSNSQSLAIGHLMDPSYPYWLAGRLDELAIFNRALSDAELQSIYDYLWSGILVNPVADTLLCDADTFSVNYTVYSGNTIGSGNVFTAQLSDAAGSFATPVSIGSVTSATSGTILCTVPSGTPNGSAYKVRVVSSAPVLESAPSVSNLHIGAGATPIVTVTSNPATAGPWTTITFTANVQNASAPSFQWRKNGIDIPSANGMTYSAVTNIDIQARDKISVFVTTREGCGGAADTVTSNQVTINIDLSVFKTENGFGINIAPNPSHGNIRINGFVPVAGQTNITITNVSGQIVYQNALNISGSTINQAINLNDVASGTYFLTLENDGKKMTRPFVINK